MGRAGGAGGIEGTLAIYRGQNICPLKLRGSCKEEDGGLGLLCPYLYQ